MKPRSIKSRAAHMLLALFMMLNLFNTAAMASGSAADAVAAAESTQSQTDIDTAQVIVSSMEKSPERTALEARLDVLQNKVDAIFNYDVSGRENGFEIYVNPEGGWNVTVQDDPLGKYGKVMQQHYVAAAPGGWNQAVFGEPISGRVTIEESIMFACTGKEARAFRAYLGLGSGSDQRLFSFYPSDHDYCQGLYLCHGNSDWLRMPGSENAVTRDKWYDIKIVIDTETKEYEAYLSRDGELIGSVKDTAYNADYSKGLASISLAPEGSSSAGDDYLYYTGVRAYIETPEIAARKLLVKAERSKTDHDILTAAKAVYALENGDVKTAFTERLAAIGDISEQDVLVSKAFETKVQADIDAAQISVASMENGAKKTAFINKLDNLQKYIDAVFSVEFSEYETGYKDYFISNGVTTEVKEADGNKYLDVNVSDSGVGGISVIHTFSDRPLTDNSFTVEQKLKFDGTFSDNFEFNIDIQGDNGYYYFERITPFNNFGGYDSGGDFIYQDGFVPGRWYNFVISYDKTTGKYTKSIIDTVTGNTEQKTNLSLNVKPEEWKEIRYRLSGNSPDKTGVVGADDFYLIISDDIKEARNAVVKAERTKTAADLLAAAKKVYGLSDSEEKSGFAERLSNCGNITEETVLVSKAEETKSQSDIDAAQIRVSAMDDSAEKILLENKLDSLQKSIDALFTIDFSEYDAGYTGYFISNGTTTEIKEAGGNKYLDAVVSSEGAGGVNEIYAIPENAIGDNSFTLEQKLKFNGSFEGFEFNIDIDGFEYYYLECITPDGNFGGYHTGGDFRYQQSGGFVQGKWYNFILSYDKTTGKYTKSIVDVETGHTEQKTNLDLQINPSGWKAIRYRLGGKSTDGKGVVGVDDFVLTVATDISSARNAVVKAERTKTEADVKAARSLVNALSESADKTALSSRLDAAAVYAPAVSAVEKAEATRLLADYNAALNIVGALEEGNIKNSLLKRLDAIEIIGADSAAENLVIAAEESLAQADIDTAQTVVAALKNSDVKINLENRLDIAQKKADSVWVADYENNSIGDTLGYHDMTVVADEDHAGNNVAKMTFNSEGGGGWSPQPSMSPVSGDFRLEQKIKWTGNECSGREFAIWARKADGNGMLIYTTFSEECGGSFLRNDWTNIAASNPMKNNTWYNIVVTGNPETKKYDIEIIDLDKNETVISLKDNTFAEDYIGSFTSFQYIIKGTTNADNQYICIDDMFVILITDYTVARDAVVKAERNKTSGNINYAQACIEAMEEGSDREALQARLDDIVSGLNISSVMFFKNGAAVDFVTPGTICAKTHIVNKTADAVNAKLAVALYKGTDANQKLVTIGISDATVLEAGASADLSAVLDVVDISDDIYQIKAFIWDENMKPLAENAVLSDAPPALRLPNFFTSDMVLQRNQAHNVWGKGVEGKNVSVSLYNDTVKSEGTAVVSDGEWEVSLDSLPAGGPYTLSVVSGAEKKTVENVFVGDVFVMAGQSNMELTYWPDTCHIDNPPIDTVLSSGNVKFFRTENVRDQAPTFDIPYRPEMNVESWSTVNNDNKQFVSMIGMYLAQEMIEVDPNVPIGLMCVAWGGTNITSWMRLSNDNKTPNFTPSDGGIYNNHIAPITKYNVAAVLWYQGCNDWQNPVMYTEAFPTLVNDYRKLWGRDELPFFYVQLARFRDANESNPQDLTAIRESQRKALDLVANKNNFAMVVSLDTDRDTYYDIHPSGKDILAERMHLLVRKFIFGEEVVFSGPLFENAAINGSKIVISFKDFSIGSGLKIKDLSNQSSNNTLKEFEVCGLNGEYISANARIVGNTVEVTVPEGIDTPKGVRYAVSAVPVNPNLYNNENLPASPFTYEFN